MKKSIYCVGQKVIFDSAYKGRLSGVVNHIDSDGNMFLTLSDNTGQFTNHNDNRVSPVESFLDPTSSYYHHTRFGEFQCRAREAFKAYMFAKNELDKLPENTPERFFTFLQNELDRYSEDYAAAVELRDLAEMNLAQWGSGADGYTLNHHFPFVNPNNLQGYHKL